MRCGGQVCRILNANTLIYKRAKFRYKCLFIRSKVLNSERLEYVNNTKERKFLHVLGYI